MSLFAFFTSIDSWQKLLNSLQQVPISAFFNMKIIFTSFKQREGVPTILFSDHDELSDWKNPMKRVHEFDLSILKSEFKF